VAAVAVAVETIEEEMTETEIEIGIEIDLNQEDAIFATRLVIMHRIAQRELCKILKEELASTADLPVIRWLIAQEGMVADLALIQEAQVDQALIVTENMENQEGIIRREEAILDLILTLNLDQEATHQDLETADPIILQELPQEIEGLEVIQAPGPDLDQAIQNTEFKEYVYIISNDL